MASKQRLLKRLFVTEFVESLAAAVIVALLLRFFAVSVYRVPTASMVPTLLPGDFILAWKTSYGVPIPFSDGERLGSTLPHRGDVIVFRREEGGTVATYSKRVVGLPGDKISIRDSRLFINDNPVTEEKMTTGVEAQSSQFPMVKESQNGRASYRVVVDSHKDEADFFGPIIVPPDSVFVLGDYRSESADSRVWGAVPLKMIEGRAALIWFSFHSSPDGSADSIQTELRGPGGIRWSRLLSPIE